MKITCQSCGAKYTIADDKVRGRTVKIRCKKCSAAIVISAAEEQPENEDGETRIYETGPGAPMPPGLMGSPAPAEDAGPEWSLNVAEGDQRTVTAEEIVQLHRSGVVSADTYVWKDGMADWAPLSEVPELMEKIRGAAPKASAAPPRPAAGATPLPANPEAAMSAAAAPKAAARRAEARGKGQDLFGGEEKPATGAIVGGKSTGSPSQVPLPKPTGLFTAERNENSVLFSLDALRAPKPATQAMPARGAAHGPEMGVGPAPSGIVDIKKLASIAPPPMDDGRPFDDIANLGGGAMMTALAAPDLTAAPPPEPPPQMMAPAMDPYGQPVKQGGGSKLVIILLAAALGIVVIGFGGFLLFGRSKTPETTPAAASATASAAPTSTDTAKPAETAAGTASGAPAGSAPTESPGAAEGKDKTAKVPGPLDTSKVGGPLPGKTADTAKPADTKAADTAKPAETAPPAGGSDKPFDRGAAVAALGAAAGAASGCKKPDGPTGTGRVSVTFAPTGRVTSANVQGPPFAGTSVGGCVAARFRSASVPPFSGGPVTVNKSFSIN